MATRLKAKTSDLYERDVYAWSKEQADLLRARRFEDMDLEHLIEEIEDVGWQPLPRGPGTGCGRSSSIS